MGKLVPTFFQPEIKMKLKMKGLHLTEFLIAKENWENAVEFFPRNCERVLQ
jgi:hypothetical protein